MNFLRLLVVLLVAAFMGVDYHKYSSGHARIILDQAELARITGGSNCGHCEAPELSENSTCNAGPDTMCMDGSTVCEQEQRETYCATRQVFDNPLRCKLVSTDHQACHEVAPQINCFSYRTCNCRLVVSQWQCTTEGEQITQHKINRCLPYQDVSCQPPPGDP